MILIADSGSTKTDWALLTANGQSTRVQTDGINPFFQNEDAVRETVSNQLLPKIGHLLWAGQSPMSSFTEPVVRPKRVL